MDLAYRCMKQPRLSEGAVSVMAVQPRHIEAIRQWRNAQLDVLRQAEPISEQQQLAYYAEHVWPAMDSAHPRNILLAIEDAGEPIGYGGLVHIAWEHARAEISFLLDPRWTAEQQTYERYFSVFLTLAKKLAFADLGLNRLFTETYAFRAEHISVLESCGFELEGVLRQHVRIDGKPTDSLVHGCLSNRSGQ